MPVVLNGNVENLFAPVVVDGKLEAPLNLVVVLNFWAFAVKAERQINANTKSLNIFCF
jgi:hypothetical protein